jgi:hypothetical protein
MNVEQYVQLNPKVWEKFRDLALTALDRNHKRLSARLIIEQIRWQTNIIENNSKFKISNHWAPRLARKFMIEYQCPGFFAIRGIKNEAKNEARPEFASL